MQEGMEIFSQLNFSHNEYAIFVQFTKICNKENKTIRGV